MGTKQTWTVYGVYVDGLAYVAAVVAGNVPALDVQDTFDGGADERFAHFVTAASPADAEALALAIIDGDEDELEVSA